MRRPRDVRGAGLATAFVGMHASWSVPPRSDSRTDATAPSPLLRLLLVSGSCGLRTEFLQTCRCNEGIGRPELRQGANIDDSAMHSADGVHPGDLVGRET